MGHALPDQAINVRTGLRPGDLGRIIALHGTAYAGSEAHFGVRFEAYVARTLAEFIIDNQGRGKVFLAERGSDLVACAAMVERRAENATHGQLRWVLADPSVRGRGLGKHLVDLAIGYARDSGWDSVFLETTGGLDASMAIYEKLGFAVESRTTSELWTENDEHIVMRLPLK